MATKTCYTCKQEIDISNFRKNKRNRDGLNGACRDCCREYARDHRANNIEKYRENYRKKNKSKKRREWIKIYQKQEKYINYHRELRKTKEHREYMRKYTATQKYRDYVNNYRKEHYVKVREKERIREEEYAKKPEVRIKRALRARLQMILKRSNGSKSGKMVELIGCTMPFLRQYLESLWREGMSWNTYGFGRGKWVIDHIIACEKFNLTNPEEQKRCFHYTNLQPLWWEENAEKSDK